jgi:hypothetical protein
MEENREFHHSHYDDNNDDRRRNRSPERDSPVEKKPQIVEEVSPAQSGGSLFISNLSRFVIVFVVIERMIVDFVIEM